MSSANVRKLVSLSCRNIDLTSTNFPIAPLDIDRFIKLIFILVLTVILSLQSPSAHADFRKALSALQSLDGTTMLSEVKDAVDKRNDDGLILYLGILKMYPKTWRSILDTNQQSALLSYLETSTAQSSLQAQYRLAVIARKVNNPPPIPAGTNEDREPWYEARIQEKLKEYQDEIIRLEPVANKGYGPAAFRLYVNYARNPTKSKADQDNAMKWLEKGAELGHPIAAYLLGMKYLNIRDDYYGCSTNPNNDLCPPKDEVKGWYWVQIAAKRANETSVMLLEDLALNIGNLYMQGVADNKPDYEQAYWWYKRVPKASIHSPVWAKLEELKKLGKLISLNPDLNKVWTGGTTWQEAVKSQDVLNAWKKSPNKLPKLMQQGLTKSNHQSPVFSMATIRWYLPNPGYAGIVLDVYEDGRANLIMGDPEFDESNNELWTKITPYHARKFFNEVQNLKLKDLPWIWPSCQGCIENRTDIVTLNNRGDTKTVELVSATFANKKESHPEVRRFLKVVEKYFPLYKLQCDVDIEEGKDVCYQIYKEFLSANEATGVLVNK